MGEASRPCCPFVSGSVLVREMSPQRFCRCRMTCTDKSCAQKVAGHGGTPICDQHRKGMGRLGIFLPRPSPCCTLFVPQEVGMGTPECVPDIAPRKGCCKLVLRGRQRVKRRFWQLLASSIMSALCHGPPWIPFARPVCSSCSRRGQQAPSGQLPLPGGATSLKISGVTVEFMTGAALCWSSQWLRPFTSWLK